MWRDRSAHKNDTSDKDFENKLKVALIKNDLIAFKRLLKGGVDVNSKHWFGSTLLHEATQMGDEQFVDVLLKANACVNAENENRRTPLHLAARSGNVAIVTMLLKGGANVNGGAHTLPVVCDESNLSSQTPLHVAVWKHRDEVAIRLLEAGADVNAEDEDGWTALHWAARLNNVGILKELICRGSFIDKRASKSRWTPLTQALLNSHSESACALVLYGADVNISLEGNAAMSNLLYAKDIPSKTKLELAKLFIECGLSIETLNKLYKEKLKTLELQTRCVAGISHLTDAGVPSLTSQCRAQIRRHLIGCSAGKSIYRKLERLPLPRLLLEYMTFSDQYQHVFNT